MDEDYIFITAKESGERIDALLTHNIDSLSRNAIQRLLEAGNVSLLHGSSFIPVKKNYKCNKGDSFRILFPDITESPLEPQNIPLDIIYEDNSLIIINKLRGMVVHPAAGHPNGTLVNALLYHCGDSLSGIGGEKRPGIVHRIDKDTSGLLIVAKTDYAHQFLSSQLSDKTLSRNYNAIVCGAMNSFSGTINKPIGRHPVDRKKMAVTDNHSRFAITHWTLLDNYKNYSHILCSLETGRTHQIRVHMASIGHPLLGDGIYGAKCPDKGLTGQCLHASHIKFIHPETKQEMTFNSPLPQYFQDVISKLGQTIDY